MRALALLLVSAGLLLGAYFFYLKRLPTSDPGTASTQAISLTGVRSDLSQIAQAERTFLATNGHCAAMDELVSSGSLANIKTERDGYSYSIECARAEYNVIARHAPAPPDAPIRYPTLAVDQDMQVHNTD